MSWEPSPKPGGLGLDRFGEVLDRVRASLGAPSASTFDVISRAWPELVGPAAAEALRPLDIRDGRLLVIAVDAQWTGQARWLEEQVVRGVERLVGPGVVTALAARTVSPRDR